MKFISTDSLLKKMKEECIYKKSEFMEKIILMDKSIYHYYKKYYNKNIFFHPIKLIKYLKLKRAIKKSINQSYIRMYLFLNQGWIESKYIPKNKNNRILEIVNYFGKQFKAKLFGYGFQIIGDDLGVMFGWTCWVKRWRFIDNESKAIELVDYNKKGKKK